MVTYVLAELPGMFMWAIGAIAHRHIAALLACLFGAWLCPSAICQNKQAERLHSGILLRFWHAGLVMAAVLAQLLGMFMWTIGAIAHRYIAALLACLCFGARLCLSAICPSKQSERLHSGIPLRSCNSCFGARIACSAYYPTASCSATLTWLASSVSSSMGSSPSMQYTA